MKRVVKKRYYYLVQILFIGTFLVAIPISSLRDRALQEDQLQYDVLQEKVEEIEVEVPVEEEPTLVAIGREAPVRNSKQEWLVRQSYGAVGWIEVVGTAIDYPVMQGEDNQYYLKHSYDGSTSQLGSIFMDYRNDTYFTDSHVVLYGHNMADGSMFHELTTFATMLDGMPAPKVIITLADKILEYEVFSAYHIRPEMLRASNFTEQGYSAFVKRCEDQSYVAFLGSELEEVQQVLTLSTCTNGRGDQRCIVHAKRINP